MSNGKVIFVTGLIAGGKTTLVDDLGRSLGEGTLVLHEPDETSGNEFLSDFYTDKSRWSYTMQTTLLGLRFGQFDYAQTHVLQTGKDAVVDGGYWQDSCFARMLSKAGDMEPREFRAYERLYKEMTKYIRLPNVCLRILCSPEVAQQRMVRRYEAREGRRCESAISVDYLRALDSEISHMVGVLRQMGVYVLEVPWAADRDSAEQRASTVTEITQRIRAHSVPDLFLDMHRRIL